MSDECAWTFEAFVVKKADEIAQRHHDIEDGINAGIFAPKDFIDTFRKNFKGTLCYNSGWVKENVKNLEKEAKHPDLNGYVLPLLRKFIVSFYIKNYVLATARTVKRGIINKYKVKDSSDFYAKKEKIWRKENINELMNFSEGFCKPDGKIRDLLKNSIVYSGKAQLMDGKGRFIIRNLFEAYLSTPNQLPDHVVVKLFADYGRIKPLKKNITKYEIDRLRTELGNDKSMGDKKLLVCLCRNICDYISSMTDRHALKQYEKLYESTIIT